MPRYNYPGSRPDSHKEIDRDLAEEATVTLAYLKSLLTSKQASELAELLKRLAILAEWAEYGMHWQFASLRGTGRGFIIDILLALASIHVTREERETVVRMKKILFEFVLDPANANLFPERLRGISLPRSEYGYFQLQPDGSRHYSLDDNFFENKLLEGFNKKDRDLFCSFLHDSRRLEIGEKRKSMKGHGKRQIGKKEHLFKKKHQLLIEGKLCMPRMYVLVVRLSELETGTYDANS